MKNKFVGIIVCLTASTLLSVFSAAFLPVNEEKIYDSVIRLHVIANSNSEADQQVKLKVRDAILEKAEKLFEGSTYEEAADIAESELELLKSTADEVLIENGISNYTSNVTLVPEEFPTRDYGDAVIPGGEYLSLCVRLGEAEGKNWWCVMFPPMCSGAAKSIKCLDECGNTDTFTKSVKPRFKLKLFLLELFN